MHKFKDLSVYQKALLFTKLVRRKTKDFPSREIFGLTSQFRRAADSIVLNIAEGAGNSTRREFSRFLDFSIRSGFECLACSDISLVNEYLSPKDHGEITEKANELVAMLYGLKKSLFG